MSSTPIQLLPLTFLRAFHVAARYESFAAAAEVLDVTPGAVSQNIKRLEGSLGYSLFDRGFRKVTLTENGKYLAKKLRPIFLDMQDLFAEMKGRKK